ncbi:MULTISPECIES: hypothetical protein [Bacillus]|uniref:Uncharacterized protein n=1 Tax=Bacillus sonorensis TaxID=119858 RepID=A0ABM6LIU9_9BACI|nr:MULTISPECIES: hypothetical protein [Bacillus]ASB89237.1 hypothetical protein S101395_02730 [Bacillus sonorensis]MEC0338439.1 hypothetical protein [Bacillus sonorensis]MEC0425296.1 hypothetical protein [Bacillus sonorensis]MEC0460850.1 hypothetical protein [Bacillus sonorensis]MEC0526505.1 hypothetical protein [Bacillus sonorensis]
MTSYSKTISHDLQGVTKLLIEGRTLPNYASGPVFSLFRDICTILYETNKVLKEEGVIHSDLPNMDIIKEIRHKVKTNQGRLNREIFNKLLNGHRNIFGSDIDNLGFYLDNDILASSTLFPTFVFAGTPLFNQNQFDKEFFSNFIPFIGSLTSKIINIINQPLDLYSNQLIIRDAKEYSNKDIWDRRFFKEDITYNIFLTRLLLIQNELTTCIWVENHLDYNSQKFNLDKYILLRLTSIKLYETMRNILDIRNRKELKQHWKAFNFNTLDTLIEKYESTLQDEMKTLRDMLHYDNKGVNFYDYIEQKFDEDSNYPDELIKTIFNDYIHIIRNAISVNINIQSYESMTDTEKITRRSKSFSNESFN